MLVASLSAFSQIERTPYNESVDSIITYTQSIGYTDIVLNDTITKEENRITRKMIRYGAVNKDNNTSVTIIDFTDTQIPYGTNAYNVNGTVVYVNSEGVYTNYVPTDTTRYINITYDLRNATKPISELNKKPEEKDGAYFGLHKGWYIITTHSLSEYKSLCKALK